MTPMNNVDYWTERKYDIDYADDVNMWELVEYDTETEEWKCLGIYAKDEGVATTLANMFELDDREQCNAD